VAVLPAFTVHPGDVMDTSVTYASGQFSLTVSDLTTGKSATDVAACSTCVRASAEWIIERPALCNSAGTKCFLTQAGRLRHQHDGGHRGPGGRRRG
jgi:hypothetical protein